VGEIETGRSVTVAKWNRSIGEMELVDGTMIYIDGADDGAYRIQGHNLRGVWADEIGLWRKWKAAWDESIAFALRKGQSRRVATGTPKRNQGARVLVARLLKDESVVSRRLSTRDNLANLSGAFVQEIRRYEGTDLGRQELEGELLEDIEGAMWRREWIDTARVERAPEMRHTVVGVDPASGGHEKALVVAGVGIDGELYVLASEADRTSSSKVWLSRVIDVALAWSATLVVERNHGAAFLTGLLDAVMAARGLHVPYRPVWASVGKTVRAEGPALLTEQGRVHFVGYHPQLEDEMCSMVVGQPGEDDLADAAVWAITELMRHGAGGGDVPVVGWQDTSSPQVAAWS
jgi:phage terminase large subunit-like protein